ncbi:uncharacterized protein LOC112595765 [Melanaphis sacchari]|uniref:uncharacterized protein LOC112595765 n=1 Tax=Melanaphis sacchari TaxID=742174 RepID=UPI000DC12D33|nr:uncharacterized protein LOC112595765 [Melanaphis sacchari]XP_025196859.1 uncharacterized protein LOC112595765 [Melanaphis sacchari]
MDHIVNENDNNCCASEVNKEKIIPSVSSVTPTTIVEETDDKIIVEQPQNLANNDTPNKSDHDRLNSSTSSVIPVLTIDDSDEEDHNNEEDHSNDKDDVIIIPDSDDDEIYEEQQMSRLTFNYSIHRLKYKIRRVINVILRYYRQSLSDDNILYLEEKRDSLRYIRTNFRSNRMSRAQTIRRPISNDQLLRRVQTLRRRYFDAIRSAHEFMYIWSGGELNYLIDSVSKYMQWINNLLLKHDTGFDNISVTRGPDGEINSNELDFVIQDIENSDSECSSVSETSTSYNTFTPAYVNQRVKHKYSYNRSISRYQRRLQRRQKLRNRFKKIHHQFYSGDGQSTTSTQMINFEKNNKYGVKNSTSTSSCSLNENVVVNKYNDEVIQVDSDSEPDCLTIDENYVNYQNICEGIHETPCQTQLENNSENLPSTYSIERDQEIDIRNIVEVEVSEPSYATIMGHVTNIETDTVTDNRCDKDEVVEPLCTNLDRVNQKINNLHGNITLREVAQTIATASRALSSTHSEIFHGITRMADALYKTTIESTSGQTEEARPGEKDTSVGTEIFNENPYIKFRQQYILNDLQKILDSIWNLMLCPLPPDLIESSASDLSTSVEAKVRRAEQVANEIVSRRRITTQPPHISTSVTQISTIDSQNSTRDTHEIYLNPSRQLDNYDDDDQSKSQQEPNSSATHEHKQPSIPIIIITPAPDDPEDSITEELPCRRNSRRTEENNSLSSHTNTKNLLVPPKRKVQHRSRSRTRDPRRPRFYSPSPPKTRVRITYQEEWREGSKLPLAESTSPASPLVLTTPHPPSLQLPCSSPAFSTDNSANSAVAVVATAETVAERPNLSPLPPEALRSTLQPTSNDDGGATATLSQTALALLELSRQSPKSDQAIDTPVVANRTVETTATSVTAVTAAAAAAAADDKKIMSNSDVPATIAVGGGGFVVKPSSKRQRSRSRRNSFSNKQKPKPSPSSESEQQPNNNL